MLKREGGMYRAGWPVSLCLVALIGARAAAESLPPPIPPPAADDKKGPGTKVKSDKEKSGEKPAPPPAGEPQK